MQGAATTCYVTTSPDLKGVSGKYFRDSKESNKVSKPAQNMDMAAALWKFSEDFVSTHEPEYFALCRSRGRIGFKLCVLSLENSGPSLSWLL